VSLRLFSAPRPAWVRRTVHQADGTYDKLHAPSGRSAGPFAARPATAITVRREVRVRYGFRHRPAQAAASGAGLPIPKRPLVGVLDSLAETAGNDKPPAAGSETKDDHEETTVSLGLSPG